MKNIPTDFPRGVKLLHDPLRNKGTAFSEEEREAFGLRGLLPPRVMTQDLQVQKLLENLRGKSSDLERYIQLIGLENRNEVLFYRLVVDHLEEIMPIIYTPTVGEACQKFGHILRRPRGLFVSANDRGRMVEVLRNWPHPEVRIIVVTDGERILGLGDQGADGMGIPIGKLSLYTACAGIHPTQCLPVMLDVGTDNEELLEDPLYIGLPQRRLRGEEYDSLVDEFFRAVAEVYPRAIIQIEDFATRNAFTVLERYRETYCTFDDDIQGTAAVALAGVFSSLRITGGKLSDQRILFLGAGEAGVGIADLAVSAMVEEGLGEQEARQRCWFLDSKGMVVASRTDLASHKKPYAHEHEFTADLLSAVGALEPTVLIGVSGTPGTFTPEVLKAMARINRRPIVFALSNPTSKSECTAKEAYTATEGQVIFASGSPFAPVVYDGRTFVPGQGNNAYIFPGVGLGLIASEASRVTDEMFSLAAKTLAEETVQSDLDCGRVYPPFTRIREVSLAIATAVAENAHERGLARTERPQDLRSHIASLMFEPRYEDYVGK